LTITSNPIDKPGPSPGFFIAVKNYIEQAGFGSILEKVEAGHRLSLDDGLQLYHSHDILALGYLADIVRTRLNGDRAYFIYNQHINYSNICTNLCKFCAFGKEKGADKAYEMTVEEVRQKYLDQVPLARGCAYDDVANAMVFLCLDASSYITGQALNIDGGQTMH